ncbi:MAG: hypothetical protein WC301_07190 [Candidatus Omnitrophota bacterium]
MLKNKIYGLALVMAAAFLFLLGISVSLKYPVVAAAFAALFIFSLSSVILWVGLVFIRTGARR